jgi:phosphoglycolate phosphatase-like HAD superfamily hydrolase
VRHLVWDWNGTLLDDLALVVAATNASLALAGGAQVNADEHRRDFRRPIADYYSHVLGRPVDQDEFLRLDRAFHTAYSAGVQTCPLAGDAHQALRAWVGPQSLLSMWFHEELVPTVARYGLEHYFARVDGLRAPVGGGPKAPHLRVHLDALGVPPAHCVLIGDSVDDAGAAAEVGAACVLYSGGFTDAALLVATGLPVVGTLTAAVQLAAAL